MPSKRSIGATAVVGACVGAAATGGVALAVQDDPTVAIEGVQVGAIDVALPVDTTGIQQTGGQQVAALDQVEGVLAGGDDPDGFTVGAVTLEFGPDEWVITAGPLADYDGDGAVEDLLEELDGLVGKEITALVRLDDDGDDAQVYVLNGLTYRDSAGGPAPWLESGSPTGEGASTQEVTEAAARAVGVGALVDELDREIVGDVAWEAEVIAADGRAYEVLLDAAANVLNVRLDD